MKRIAKSAQKKGAAMPVTTKAGIDAKPLVVHPVNTFKPNGAATGDAGTPNTAPPAGSE